MLQSITCPNIGHAIVHHFGEGAAVWGQAITPSIAHLVQAHRELAIDYSRIRPGIVFETVSSVAMLPHVIDGSTFRIHVESTAFRRTVVRREAAVEAFVRCDTGAGCTLKLWGRVATESPSQQSDQLAAIDDRTAATVPVIFTVTFWEISRAPDARMEQMIKEVSEKDRKIRELELKVALSMCSQ
ncbi:hypothetical protein N2599_29290 (plasmid) [Rhizobium sullae]|uniref:Uncharacterized protein n=1 Tax=Rhizobium sullae TaxID=50338 RepID=A0A2N0D1G1_RHISU|nr:hypothetical protein [Rhizobium sullae]PKA39926.1 hypothetical protein CWR43_30095 [Rhizobium sullae]UWU16911.1 hypothetical protein N2599_29290 [Rhizobium sullae]